jgi:2-polyprenyl-6-hydroxyphenyl methylase/3-demethylubiquinone-9 3-methyltransferase
MSERPATDRRQSVAAAEFLWDTAGLSAAHQYLIAPVMAALRAAHANTVLDLGCGNGALSNHIARHGLTVSGLDHSLSGLQIARHRYQGVNLAQHDLAQPLPAEHVGRYDAVVSVEVIEHLLLPRLLLRSAQQALRPGGLLILTTPHHGYWKNLAIALCGGFDQHWHPLRDYGHIKFFSRSTLRAMALECGFTALRIAGAGRAPPFSKSMVLTGIRPP